MTDGEGPTMMWGCASNSGVCGVCGVCGGVLVEVSMSRCLLFK